MNESFTDLVTWATFITAIATLATVGILMWQTKIAKNISHADFTLRLHNDFYFNPKHSQLIRTLEHGNPILQKNGGQFNDSDLDDYLGVIELLAIYIEKGTLSEKTVDGMFGYYIVKTWETQEIQNYVTHIRKALKNNEYYSGLENLALKFKDS